MSPDRRCQVTLTIFACFLRDSIGFSRSCGEGLGEKEGQRHMDHMAGSISMFDPIARDLGWQ